MKKSTAVLAVAALTAGLAATAAVPAQAATIVIVPSTDAAPIWANSDTRPAGHSEYVDGGLHVWTDYDATGSPDPRKVSLATEASYPLADAGTLEIDYTNNDEAAFEHGPGLNLVVDFDGDGDKDGTLVYEEVYGQDLWLTGGSADFVKDEAPVDGGGNGSQWHGTIDEWVAEFPDADVIKLAFALGSGVNANGVIHSITAFGNQYTFDLAPVPAIVVPSTDAAPIWVNYETRPAGHSEYVDGGLHVWTDYAATGSPDPRKVSLATPANYPLADAGTLEIDYTNNDQAAFAYGPGLNLVVDFDGDGVKDGTLVYEAVYGQDLWLTNGSDDTVKTNAPVIGGGNGSNWHGTIDQWVGKFPNANVLGLAFSLGSGVNANGVIHSITAFGNEYTFDLAPVVVPPTEAITPFADGVTRLGGPTRYETALAASARYAPGVDAVLVATGTDFPDALSAAAAAAELGGPLLLTPKDSLPATVLAELKRLQPDEIYVVGGTGAVSQKVFKEIAAVAPTTRLGGADRYATGIEIVNSTFQKSTHAILATGRDFPDALAATGVAGKLGAPVILVDGTKAAVSPATLKALSELGVTSVTIAGGNGVVSSGIEKQLGKAGYAVERFGGATRYDTAALINGEFFPAGSSPIMFLATGADFPDALAGAAMAGRLEAPIFITRAAGTPPVIHDAIEALGASKRVVMGGTGVVSEAAADNTEYGD